MWDSCLREALQYRYCVTKDLAFVRGKLPEPMVEPGILAPL
jgi:hypothetical protein